MRTTRWMVALGLVALGLAAGPARGQLARILSEDFAAAGEWTYAGVTNATGQPLFRHDPTNGVLAAEWDQANYIYDWSDPFVILSSSWLRPLGKTLTDRDSFRVGVTLRLTPGSVPDTTEFFQIANFGLYNPAEMGPDRGMSDNWSGNTELVRDGSDFVEFNYFIMNKSWGVNPCVTATIGCHVDGSDGDYVTGTAADPMFHDTDMGADHWLPEGTNLYLELCYYGGETGAVARRAYCAVYTDPARTTLLTVNGVEMYYWTQPVPEDKTFAVTHVGFYNYPASNWGGVNGAGAGTFDDLFVEAWAMQYRREHSDLVLSWPAQSGRVYRVLACTNLLSGVWTTNAVVTATGPEAGFRTNVNGGTIFYRVAY